MFKENIEYPIEVQFDSDQNKELSYRIRSKLGMKYFELLLQHFPNALSLISLDSIELISYHKADQLSYLNDCICLVINQSPNINDSSLIDFYVLKLDLTTLKIKKKYYRKYQNQEIQYLKDVFKDVLSFRIAFEFGVGYYPEVEDYKDFYFYIDFKDLEKVQKLLKVQVNDIKEDKVLLAITTKSDKVVKVKRYLYQYKLTNNTIQDIYGHGN